ncbi:MAG: hypothetical protein ACO3RB_03295 [Ilumatobacteraceae bacterium]
MRRMFWFFLGAVAGASAVVWVRRKAESVAEKLTPAALFEELRHIATVLWSKVWSLVRPVDEG